MFKVKHFIFQIKRRKMILPLLASLVLPLHVFTIASVVSPIFSPVLPNFRFVGETRAAGVVGPLGELRFFNKREVSFPKKNIFEGNSFEVFKNGQERGELIQASRVTPMGELKFFNKRGEKKIPDSFENRESFEVLKNGLPQQKREGITIQGLVEKKREVRVRREARLIKDPRFVFLLLFRLRPSSISSWFSKRNVIFSTICFPSISTVKA